MGLFKPDLYRSFAVGFLIGAAILGANLGGEGRSQIAAQYAPAAFR